jgi:hypothetical protein
MKRDNEEQPKMCAQNHFSYKEQLETKVTKIEIEELPILELNKKKTVKYSPAFRK